MLSRHVPVAPPSPSRSAEQTPAPPTPSAFFQLATPNPATLSNSSAPRASHPSTSQLSSAPTPPPVSALPIPPRLAPRSTPPLDNGTTSSTLRPSTAKLHSHCPPIRTYRRIWSLRFNSGLLRLVSLRGPLLLCRL
jgi:hypothetical protein